MEIAFALDRRCYMAKMKMNNESAIKHAIEITKIAIESGNINLSLGASPEDKAKAVANFYHSLASELAGKNE